MNCYGKVDDKWFSDWVYWIVYMYVHVLVSVCVYVVSTCMYMTTVAIYRTQLGLIRYRLVVEGFVSLERSTYADDYESMER